MMPPALQRLISECHYEGAPRAANCAEEFIRSGYVNEHPRSIAHVLKDIESWVTEEDGHSCLPEHLRLLIPEHRASWLQPFINKLLTLKSSDPEAFDAIQ